MDISLHVIGVSKILRSVRETRHILRNVVFFMYPVSESDTL